MLHLQEQEEHQLRRELADATARLATARSGAASDPAAAAAAMEITAALQALSMRLDDATSQLELDRAEVAVLRLQAQQAASRSLRSVKSCCQQLVHCLLVVCAALLELMLYPAGV